MTIFSRRGAALPPDCVLTGEVALVEDVGNGVAPALSSALNVMAFAHELDLGTTGTWNYELCTTQTLGTVTL
jgi:hypothetical protein